MTLFTRKITVAMIGGALLLLTSCAKTPDMIQRVLGRDVAAQRVSAGDAWCPTITTFAVSPVTVQCGDSVTLDLAATAPPGQELTYIWEIEGQTFETGHHALWKTPTCQTIEEPNQIYTVRGVVSDGQCSVTRSVEVKVLCNCAFDVMVNFAFARAELDATARTNLDTFGEKLRQHPDYAILIEGHTDDIGSSGYNAQLGKKRAEAVKQYLETTWNIEPDRLMTRSFGEEEPIAPNASEIGRAKNRRAEIFRIVFKTK